VTEDVVYCTFFLILIVLTAGDPDLLDAIISRVMKG